MSLKYIEIITFLLILIGCSECNSVSKEYSNVEIQCNKVLIVDTLFNPTFCFVLEFKNKGASDKLFFNNYIFDDSLVKASLVLRDTVLSNFNCQIGSTLHSKSFIVKAGRSRKLIFIFKNRTSDSISRSDFEKIKSVYQKQIRGNWFDAFVANIQLAYRYSDKINDSIELPHLDDKYEIIKEDITVSKKNPEIIYFDKLTSEQANRFILE